MSSTSSRSPRITMSTVLPAMSISVSVLPTMNWFTCNPTAVVVREYSPAFAGLTLMTTSSLPSETVLPTLTTPSTLESRSSSLRDTSEISLKLGPVMLTSKSPCAGPAAMPETVMLTSSPRSGRDWRTMSSTSSGTSSDSLTNAPARWKPPAAPAVELFRAPAYGRLV